MSGACNITFEELKKSDAVIIGKDSRISELELQLATVESAQEAKESKWKKKLEAEKVQIDNAQKESGDLKAEVARLKEHPLQQDKVAADTVPKFKAYEAYDQAIADAGAPEILRSWIVAERHIKTDPAANWDSFIEEFLVAKDNLEKGLRESVPYNGPNPAFLPGPQAN